MSTVASLLATARQHIPAAEARLLLGHLLGRNTAWLEAHRDDRVDVEHDYSVLVRRRHAGEPIAYLIGWREFYGREFLVNPAVLIPRPETELLVDLAKREVGAGETARILDLGTGSGCLAVTLALEIPGAEVVAVDVSPAALSVARTNAHALGAVVSFVESDWWTALRDPAVQAFDLIVANPPYIAQGDAHLTNGDVRFEPRQALTDQADGLTAIRHIIAGASDWLNPGGRLWLEHGYDQSARVKQALEQAGLIDIQQHIDLAGIPRVAGGRRAGSAGLVFSTNNQ
jgi:release factor glutamine methyltransferase